MLRSVFNISDRLLEMDWTVQRRTNNTTNMHADMKMKKSLTLIETTLAGITNRRIAGVEHEQR